MGTVKKIGIGVVIGLIVNGLVLGIPYVLNLFGVDSPLNLLMTQFPIWITILVVIILVPSIIMFSRKGNSGIVVSSSHRRPEGDVFIIIYNYAGVKWKVLYGGANRYTRSEPYAFCETRPECPECEYEMESEKRGLILKRYYWKCDRCGTVYRCPTKHPYDAHKIVERLTEADVRSGRLKLDE